MEDDFQFRLDQWYSAVVAPAPPPAGAPIVLLLDPAFTATEQSDESSYCVSYKSQREGDGITVLNVLDMAADKWRGKLLVDTALSLIQKWAPTKFNYENGTGMDFFYDLLLLKAELKGIILPRIEPFTPRNGRLQKSNRIRRIQSLFDIDPAAIVFHRGAYFEKLCEQAERFQMNSDRKRRRNDMLDSLALSAGFR
jgi:hypothetical protein